MTFFDKVKEVGVKGMDKAKDLGEMGKLKFDKAGAEGDLKAIYAQIGAALVEKFPEFLAENFAEEAGKLNEIKEKIAQIEATLAEVKDDKKD